MILWVDDNDDLRRAVAEHLSAAGHRVVEAASAEEALERLDEIGEEGSLDLLLTDFRLPGKNGLELARSIRRAEPGLPVLLVTSHAEPQDLILWADDPAFRKLDKPFELDHLNGLISDLLAGETERPDTNRADHLAAPRRSPPASRARFRPALAAALSLAAVSLAVLVALPWLGPAEGPPALPDGPTAATTQRSSVVVTSSPFGPVADVPDRFVWQPVAGAERYVLEVSDVAGKVLWRDEGTGPEHAIPAELAERLLPLAAYYWRVEALGDQGELLASSEPVRFRIVTHASATP